MLRPFALAAGVVAAAAALAVTLPVVEAQPTHPHESACFYLRDIQGSKLASPRDYYFRADGGRVYHLEFGADCATAHSYPLILRSIDNSGEVCNAVGLDVRVRDTGEECITRRLSVLSPDEAAALPKDARP